MTILPFNAQSAERLASTPLERTETSFPAPTRTVQAEALLLAKR